MTKTPTLPNLQTLRALAEAVKDWSNCNQAWQHRDPDYEGIAVVGAVDEDGIDWPLAEIDADTYGHDGESLKLAQFYAAANPAAVLALLDAMVNLARLTHTLRQINHEQRKLLDSTICGRSPILEAEWLRILRVIERAHVEASATQHLGELPVQTTAAGG